MDPEWDGDELDAELFQHRLMAKYDKENDNAHANSIEKLKRNPSVETYKEYIRITNEVFKQYRLNRLNKKSKDTFADIRELL